MDKIEEFEIIKKFGPSILRVKIPISIVDEINNYVDKIIKDEELSKKLNHGDQLVGDVTQEIKLEPEFMQKSGWGNFLGVSVGKWIASEIGKKITKFNVLESWVVRQYKNEYNPVHWHSGHVSGVGYLKVPQNLGNNKQENKKRNENGKLELIHGSKMFLSDSTFTITPKVGDFYFFPNYMMHSVYPFADTNEERRSISFNAEIDRSIYDTYKAG